MPKYTVQLEDGRSIDVMAPDEAGAKSQARHQENTRVLMQTKKGGKADPDLALPTGVTFVKP